MSRTYPGLQNFEFVIKINPNYYDAYENKALVLNELNKSKDALDTINITPVSLKRSVKML